jgi:hypothetical protein
VRGEVADQEVGAGWQIERQRLRLAGFQIFNDTQDFDFVFDRTRRIEVVR